MTLLVASPQGHLPLPTSDVGLRLCKSMIPPDVYASLMAERHPAVASSGKITSSSSSRWRRRGRGFGEDDVEETTGAAAIAAGDDEAAELEASMETDDLYGDDLYGGLGGEDEADGVDVETGEGADAGEDQSPSLATAEGADALAPALSVGGANGGDGAEAVIYTEPPTVYDKQELSSARLQLLVRANAGQRQNEQLLARARQCLQ